MQGVCVAKRFRTDALDGGPAAIYCIPGTHHQVHKVDLILHCFKGIHAFRAVLIGIDTWVYLKKKTQPGVQISPTPFSPFSLEKMEPVGNVLHMKAGYANPGKKERLMIPPVRGSAG